LLVACKKHSITSAPEGLYFLAIRIKTTNSNQEEAS